MELMALYLQSWHNKVCSGIYPISCLHTIRSSNPAHTGISVQVHIQFELPYKIKRLKVVVSRLVIRTRILGVLDDS